MPSKNATSDAVRAHFRSQGQACARLGSPFTARLCAVLADVLTLETPLGARVLTWPSDPTGDALALRVCGGFQAMSWEDANLAALYPPAKISEQSFTAGLVEWMKQNDARLMPRLDGPPQTNEVSRCSALLGGLLHIGGEIELLEVGASAGLNLYPDRYAYDLGEGVQYGDGPVRIVTEWSGQCPPLDQGLRIVSRAGCDVAPIHVADDAARRRLRAYVWPDQPARIARFEGAVAMVADAQPDIRKLGAAEFLRETLAAPVPEGRIRVVQHSIMWQYMPDEEQEQAEHAIRSAGARDGARLAWLRLEADDTPGSAAILLTRFPDGRTVELGRGDFHGRWVRWH